MVTSCAPVRISFGGGGTDLEAYYARFGGYVLSTTINQYCYVTATQPTDEGVSIRSTSISSFDRQSSAASNENILSRLTCAAIALLGSNDLVRRGVQLTFVSDVPPGTGLGTSSATAVALLHALAAYADIPTDAATLARQACELEIEHLGMPIGKQDQYSSAFGGMNSITFTCDDVAVTRLALAEHVLQALQPRLLLFSTGQRHDSSTILREQRDNTQLRQDTVMRLHQLKAIGTAMCRALLANDLDAFGRLLDCGWREKRQLSAGITNGDIDRWYAAARTAGALGGKITGAGGGGYLMLYVPLWRAQRVRRCMEELGLRELPFAFEPDGVRSLPRLPTEHLTRLARRGISFRYQSQQMALLSRGNTHQGQPVVR
jgi:D-glycero-alpha-D-manno-heptose-7-phosphate kinase